MSLFYLHWLNKSAALRWSAQTSLFSVNIDGFDIIGTYFNFSGLSHSDTEFKKASYIFGFTLLWLPGPELRSLVRYSCSDQGVLEAIIESELAVNWAGKPSSITRNFKGVRSQQNLQKRFICGLSQKMTTLRGILPVKRLNRAGICESDLCGWSLCWIFFYKKKKCLYRHGSMQTENAAIKWSVH